MEMQSVGKVPNDGAQVFTFQLLPGVAGKETLGILGELCGQVQ